MTIPISMIAYCLSKKMMSPLKLYVLLKYTTSGHFKINRYTVNEVCRKLKWKDKSTFNNNLKALLDAGFVCINRKRNSVRIKSYAKVAAKLKMQGRTGVVFTMKDFSSFRPFCYAAIVHFYMRYKYHREKSSARKTGGARLDRHTGEKTMPVRYLSRVLKLDHSTISKYRKAAHNEGYIRLVPRYRNLHEPAERIDEFKMIVPINIAPKYIVVNHDICIQKASVIYSSMELRRKRVRT
ncbi:hypothetical protein EYV94_08110 [Puteibacter caeruleilacunae]|nr:hypothetical protein EYV94_08110 [Puteibacter caeruleilacunae]